MLRIAKKIILRGIRLYQATFSPDHGPLAHEQMGGFCRFHPTCSEYAYQSIDKNGLFIGVIQAIGRVLRCNPFSRGGIDPVK